MKDDKTVIINGRKYDKNSGLPMGEVNPGPAKEVKKSVIKTVQTITAKSKTPYSRTAQKIFNDIQAPRRKPGHNIDIPKSKHISRFAPNIKQPPQKPVQLKKSLDVKPISHPIAAKVEKLRTNVKKTILTTPPKKSLKTIKEEVIAEALNKSSTPTVTKTRFLIRHRKYINIFSICVAFILITGCLIYMNMPGISVRVADFQTGINATFPEYCPDGYSLSGPVTYSGDQVTISFHANTGDGKFAITQSNSSWDSSALKIQVDQDSNDQTFESEASGLTIYTYNNNNDADWVNGGILYSITGNAKLSSDQIRRMATSF
jgi:hypothetical protein